VFFFFFTTGLFSWFSTVVVESGHGYHTVAVRTGLRYGMILFIVSEIMFFFCFLLSFFPRKFIAFNCNWWNLTPQKYSIFRCLRITFSKYTSSFIVRSDNYFGTSCSFLDDSFFFFLHCLIYLYSVQLFLELFFYIVNLLNIN